MKILPSLLYTDFAQFTVRFNECVQLGEAVHIDFADGEFVPNRLPSIDKVKSLPGEIVIEAHFMVQKPVSWVESALQDSRFQTLIIHAEADVDISHTATLVKKSGRKVGLALKPNTAIDEVATSLDLVDQVLVLLVDPGFNGSPFIPEVVRKIQQIRRRFPNIIVEADGGMNPDTLLQAKDAGAHQAAIGSFLHDKDLVQSLQLLRDHLGGADH